MKHWKGFSVLGWGMVPLFQKRFYRFKSCVDERNLEVFLESNTWTVTNNHSKKIDEKWISCKKKEDKNQIITNYFLFQFVEIGIVTSIESNHKQVDKARKGQEICIKIEPIPGEAPKMFNRHFEADDMLVSKVNSLI